MSMPPFDMVRGEGALSLSLSEPLPRRLWCHQACRALAAAEMSPSVGVVYTSVSLELSLYPLIRLIGI